MVAGKRFKVSCFHLGLPLGGWTEKASKEPARQWLKEAIRKELQSEHFAPEQV